MRGNDCTAGWAWTGLTREAAVLRAQQANQPGANDYWAYEARLYAELPEGPPWYELIMEDDD
jgi:hypothetical protein